jgi:hypothetical protein
MSFCSLRTLIVVLLVGLASGCGGPYDATVSGIVMLDGTPVPRGTVAFHPTAGGAAGYAPIEANGSYAVRTGREIGLNAGEYQVTVAANEPPSQEDIAKGGAPPPGKPIAPVWYRTKETSGLTFNVERGSNKINLELTSQPPTGWNPRGR